MGTSLTSRTSMTVFGLLAGANDQGLLARFQFQQTDFSIPEVLEVARVFHHEGERLGTHGDGDFASPLAFATALQNRQCGDSLPLHIEMPLAPVRLVRPSSPRCSCAAVVRNADSYRASRRRGQPARSSRPAAAEPRGERSASKGPLVSTITTCWNRPACAVVELSIARCPV